MTDALPPRLLAYYGDDFTGSTDVMEALTAAGLPAVLFLRPPTPEDLRAHPEARAIGVAGSSRSMRPVEMERELPPVFAALRALGAPLVHYKVCSTFDSSPELGSIGKAIDLAQAAFGSPFVPVVVGAPSLRRYVAFGNLFARSGLESPVYRLDRHPTMSRHPSTPMDESDLRRVLARQTSRRMDLVDAIQLEHAPAEGLEAALAEGAEIVLFDTLTDVHLRAIGELVWARAEPGRTLFAAGSSGLEYALVAHWQERGLLPEPPVLRVNPVEQIVVVSGSCSPVTERQIAWAIQHGFAEMALSPARLLTENAAEVEREAAMRKAVAEIRRGRSVILHTSRGPDDTRIRDTAEALAVRGGDGGTAELLGGALGSILRAVLRETGLCRAATTGGDTSYYAARALGVKSLEMAAPCAPGSPLCRLRTRDPALDGCEVVFKGGQVGTTDFFGRVLRGA